MNHPWKEIGVIGRAQGLKGDFFVNRQGLLPESHKDVVIGDTPQNGLHASILSQKIYKNKSLIRLSKLLDRTALEPYVGKILWGKSNIADNPFEDFLGVEIFDQQKQYVGKIHEVYNHGGTDNIELQDQEGNFLEIPLCEAYFLHRDDPEKIQLACEKEIFDDFWYHPKTKK